MRALRVAIVGAGVISRVHAGVLSSRGDVVLAAIVDPDLDAAKRLAGELPRHPDRPSLYRSLTQALTVEPIDLVVVTSHSSSHAELAETAIEAGCHVLLEKPVDTDLARARRLCGLAAESDRVVGVVSQRRFAPAVMAITDAVRSGRLGRITSATATLAWWRGDDYYASAAWRGTWAGDGGGALMNQGIHAVDILLSIMGTPVAVTGTARTLAHESLEVEDVAAAVVTFESGAVATLLATTAAFPENSTRFQIHGTRGSAFVQDGRLEYFGVDHPPSTVVTPEGARVGDRSTHEVPSYALPGAASDSDALSDHGRQYDDLIDAIHQRHEPRASLHDAGRALAVIVAVYLSHTLERPVRFAEVMAGDYDALDYRSPIRQGTEGTV